MNMTLFSTLLWLLLPADWAGGHIAAGLWASRCRLCWLVSPSCSGEYYKGVNVNKISRYFHKIWIKAVLLAKILKTFRQWGKIIADKCSNVKWRGAFSEYCVLRDTVDTFKVLITIRIKRSIVKIRVTPACCQPATPHCGTIVNLTIHEILWQKNCHLHISSDVLITKHFVLFFCQN